MPGFADHKYRLAPAPFGELPALEQHAELAAPADEPRKGVAAGRIEAAFDLAFAAHQEDGHTVLRAFELARAERFELEGLAREAARDVRNDHLAGSATVCKRAARFGV